MKLEKDETSIQCIEHDTSRPVNFRGHIQCTGTIRLTTQPVRKSADTWQMTMTI